MFQGTAGNDGPPGPPGERVSPSYTLSEVVLIHMGTNKGHIIETVCQYCLCIRNCALAIQCHLLFPKQVFWSGKLARHAIHILSCNRCCHFGFSFNAIYLF